MPHPINHALCKVDAAICWGQAAEADRTSNANGELQAWRVRRPGSVIRVPPSLPQDDNRHPFGAQMT
jgi:hypothetical protein